MGQKRVSDAERKQKLDDVVTALRAEAEAKYPGRFQVDILRGAIRVVRVPPGQEVK